MFCSGTNYRCLWTGPYSNDPFSKNIKNFLCKQKIVNNHSIPSMHVERQITNLSVKHSFTLYPSLNPYRWTESRTEKQIHLLCMGWVEPFFQLCCCVSFWFWREIGFGFTYYYVLGVSYSCGVVLVFLILAENSFWCYVHTQSTIQLCGCVIFVVVAGKLILYKFSYSIRIFFFFCFWQEIVFGVKQVLSAQYSCAVVSVFVVVAGKLILYKYLTVTIVSQKYQKLSL